MGNGRVDRTPSFASGDPRFIYAARRDTSELVLLPHGQAEAFRELARTQLMCPVRGCPAPQVTTVGGDRRHHYRHLVKAASTDHSPETWHHLEAKQVLEAWAKERYPGAIVEQEKVLGSRDRIADVFVTLPDGSRYAIEVQFSSLTTDQFRERHRWYRDAGIVDVWLFIHAGVQLRQDWDRTLRVTYSPTHHAVAQTGAPMFWVNPQQKMIGYATRTINVGGHTYRTHADREGEFHTEPLEDFTLSPTGMTSDALAAIDADSNAARAAIETAARAHAAAEERRQQDLVRRAHAVERAASSKRLAAGERSTIRAEILVRWESSSEGRDALEQFGGLLLPMWLLDDGDLEVTIPGRVWKWRLVRTRVLPLQSGQYLTASLLLRELNSPTRACFRRKPPNGNWT